MAAIVQHRKTIKVYAATFSALKHLQQPSLSHRCIQVVYGTSQNRRIGLVIPIFILMNYQFVCWYLHRKQVIGDPLMEQVLRTRVFVICFIVIIIAIQVILQNPLLQLLKQLRVTGVNPL